MVKNLAQMKLAKLKLKFIVNANGGTNLEFVDLIARSFKMI